jgi:hypothetical protein
MMKLEFLLKRKKHILSIFGYKCSQWIHPHDFIRSVPEKIGNRRADIRVIQDSNLWSRLRLGRFPRAFGIFFHLPRVDLPRAFYR